MTAALPDDDWSLGDARDWLRDRVEDGEHCPCCTQFAKVYRRKINTRQTLALVTLYRLCGTEWGHVPSLDPRLAGDGGMIAYLRWWGLIEESTELREDGGRSGWWRITQLGDDWLHCRVAVPKYALIYDGRCLGLDGDSCWIADAINNRFDLRELMAGV